MDARVPFCHTCGVIQPPRSIDHFACLGMTPTFEIDPQELERKYFAFQRTFHPDRFAAKSPKEKAISMQHATNLNQAYDVLNDTLSRAEYLLSMQNSEEDAPGCTTVNDPVLLIEAMELREELADASDAETVSGIIQRTQADIDECIEELKPEFADGHLEAAAHLTTRLKYLSKLMDEARQRQLQLIKSQ